MEKSRRKFSHQYHLIYSNQSDNVPSPDGQGKHEPGVKITENTIALTKKHIRFYQPRKDQRWCYKYDLKKPEDQAEKLEKYELHKKRKDAANSAKKEDDERDKNDRTFVTVNFDLEAVLYCPLFFANPYFINESWQYTPLPFMKQQRNRVIVSYGRKRQARGEQRKSPHVYQYL
ncbi:hypothetical protein ILUMI_03027 [Ignelater luminosus]|uniref:Uncharacterized protein n=1 Tax=Ignelater luminosus TaxID=2038154 RepID=A0A8K0DH98_IGNLU|nr:hypothetical protein ILUMI_03027 [Ignelater luminosus]